MKTTALSVAIVKHVENGNILPIRNLRGVDDDKDLTKYPRPIDIVTKEVFMLQSLEELPVGMWSQDHRQKQEKSKKVVVNSVPSSTDREQHGESEGNAKGK